MESAAGGSNDLLQETASEPANDATIPESDDTISPVKHVMRGVRDRYVRCLPTRHICLSEITRPRQYGLRRLADREERTAVFFAVDQLMHQNRSAQYIGTACIAVVPLLSALSVWRALQSGHRTQIPPSDPHVGFQSSSARSTTDILLACVSTLLICVLKVVHPNIPVYPTHRLNFFRALSSPYAWRVRCNTAIQWGQALLVPEVVATVALMDFLDARKDVELMDEATHGRWTIKHAFFAQMHGFYLPDGTILEAGYQILSIPGGKQLIEQLDLERVKHEIADKEKADAFTKLLAVLQISRFFAGILARRIEYLAISPLEYVTCAYVLCGVTTYGLLLDKPFNVLEPICLQAPSTAQVSR